MSIVIDGTNGITFPDASVQAESGLGFGQTYQDVTASRVSGTTYTNSTGKPIEVCIAITTTAASANVSSIAVTVLGLAITSSYDYYSGALAQTTKANVSFIVPNGATYSATMIGTTFAWTELR